MLKVEPMGGGKELAERRFMVSYGQHMKNPTTVIID